MSLENVRVAQLAGLVRDRGAIVVDVQNEDFMTGVEATDCGPMITNAITFANSLNHPFILNFSPRVGGYPIFPTGSLYTTLGTITNKDGVGFYGQHAVLVIGNRVVGVNLGTMFNIVNCRNIVFDLTITGPNTLDGSALPKGVMGMQFSQGSKHITGRLRALGGIISAVQFTRTSATDGESNRCRDIRLALDTENCWYGVAGQWSGDNMHVNIRSKACYRTWYIYGVHHQRCNAIVNDHKGGACLIRSFSGKGCEDVRLNYTNIGSTAAVQFPHIDMGYDDIAGYHADVRVNLNVDLPVGANGSNVFNLEKRIAATGNPDTTDRGHVLDGFQLSGRVVGNPTGGTGPVVGMFPGCEWGTGDFIRGFRLKNLILRSSRYSDWYGAAFDRVTLENVKSDHVIRFRTSNAVDQTMAARIAVRNCDFPNVYKFVAGDYPIKHRIYTGNFTLPVGWMYNNTIISDEFAGGLTTLSAPAFVAGMDVTFHRTIASNMRVDPTATNTIATGAAGKYMQIGTTGGCVRLRCLVDNKMEIVHEKGTVTFEP